MRLNRKAATAATVIALGGGLGIAAAGPALATTSASCNSGRLTFYAATNHCYVDAGTISLSLHGVTDFTSAGNTGYFDSSNGTLDFTRYIHLPANADWEGISVTLLHIDPA
jgi:hypothetical protein